MESETGDTEVLRAFNPNASAPARPAERQQSPVPEEREVLPRRMKNYELISEIGRGGMGVVYKARHVELDRIVALKIMRKAIPDSDEMVRFVSEAQVTGQIEHPNIVPVHELGADDKNRPYFVMKLVYGRPLNALLTQLRNGDAAVRAEFPISRLLEIFEEICKAVAFAHSQGVLHRDLKPSNIMIGDFGEVLVMDWGLAKKFGTPLIAGSESAGVIEHKHKKPVEVYKPVSSKRIKLETEAGMVAGTPEYMSPEQIMGEKNLTPKSDVYSLGSLLFEMLTLRPPHIDPDTRILMRKVVTRMVEFPKPSKRHPLISRPLQAVTLKALAQKPEHRYADVRAMMTDIRAVAEDQPVSAFKDAPVDRLARIMRRHGVVLGVGLVTVTLLSLAAVAVSYSFQKSEKDRADAAEKVARAQESREIEARKLEEAERLRRQEIEKNMKLDAARHNAESGQVKQAQRLAKAIPSYVDALELMRRRQWDAALERLSAVIEIDPNSPVAAMAHIASGEVLRRKGTKENAEAAITHFLEADRITREASTEKSAGDARALFSCGEVAWTVLNDSNRATDFYERAAQANPKSPYGLMGRAYALIIKGRASSDAAVVKDCAKQALELSERAAGLGDYLWEAHYVVGTLYSGAELALSELKDPTRALPHFKQALNLEPNIPELWFQRAQAYIQTGDAESALADLTSALRLRSDWPQALAVRAPLLIQLNRNEEALRDLDKLLSSSDKSWSTSLPMLTARAQALTGLQKWAEAEEAWARVTEANPIRKESPTPEALSALRQRAQARLKLLKFQDALKDADKVLEFDPTQADALVIRAESRLGLGGDQVAVEDFQRILKQFPNNAMAHRGLAEVYKQQGQFKEAVESYQKALSIQPDWQEVRLSLAQVLINDPKALYYDPKTALELCREAERRANSASKDARIWTIQVEALILLAHYTEAVEVAERAYTQLPTDDAVLEARNRARQKQAENPEKKARPKPTARFLGQ